MMPAGCITYLFWCTFVAFGCIIGAERGISAGQTLLTFFLGIFLVPVVYLLVVGWSGNAPAPRSPRRVIVSDAPYHSENNAKLAAELANQRHVGRNRGGDMDVFVSYNPHNQSGNHAENRHVEWLQGVVPGHTQTRAEEAGIHVHIVSEYERDMRSAQAQNSGRSWDWNVGRIFGEDD